MLTMTDEARDKFKEFMKQHEGKYLRVIFEGFGWGGPRLGLTLDESKNDEETYTVNGIDLMIDERVLPYTDHNLIDYITNAYGEGFAINRTAGSACW